MFRKKTTVPCHLPERHLSYKVCHECEATVSSTVHEGTLNLEGHNSWAPVWVGVIYSKNWMNDINTGLIYSQSVCFILYTTVLCWITSCIRSIFSCLFSFTNKVCDIYWWSCVHRCNMNPVTASGVRTQQLGSRCQYLRVWKRGVKRNSWQWSQDFIAQHRHVRNPPEVVTSHCQNYVACIGLRMYSGQWYIG